MTVTITNGTCSASEMIQLDSAGSLDFGIEVTNREVDCDGNEIQPPRLEVENISGDTGPICFTWEGEAFPPGIEAESFLQGPWVRVGTEYTLTLEDKTTGCREIRRATPGQESVGEVDFAFDLVSPDCPEGNEGQIIITPTAGPVTCLDADGNPLIDCTLSDLAAGEYDLTIIDDATSCPKDTTFTIVDPVAIPFDIEVTLVSPICPGGRDGQILISTPGGCLLYTSPSPRDRG